MKKLVILVFTLVVMMYLTDASLWAQSGRGGGKGPGVNQSQGRGRPETQRPDRQGRPDRPDRAGPNRGPERDRENKVVERFERNPEMRARVEALLPSGMTLADASNGFKNHGQFIAALHVSKNLNIPFDQLKARITRDDDRMSLGEAIHDLRPEMTENAAKNEAKKAGKQAKDTEKTKTTR